MIVNPDYYYILDTSTGLNTPKLLRVEFIHKIQAQAYLNGIGESRKRDLFIVEGIAARESKVFFYKVQTKKPLTGIYHNSLHKYVIPTTHHYSDKSYRTHYRRRQRKLLKAWKITVLISENTNM